MMRLCLISTLLVALAAYGCKNDPATIRMATTTSVESSGLLSYLIPQFEKESGMKVEYVAVGTGAALKLGENGDVDCVLVHSKPEEEKFVKSGYGVNRTEIAFNYYVIVGPPTDPANIKDCKSTSECFAKIYKSKAKFASRGDDSGTHKKERQIWNALKFTPWSEKATWYVEIGQGMGFVLNYCFEKQCYTLSDNATYVAYKNKGNLAILFEGDPALLNIYSFITVTNARHRKEAMMLQLWLASERGQELIESYKINGNTVFYPIKGARLLK